VNAGEPGVSGKPWDAGDGAALRPGVTPRKPMRSSPRGYPRPAPGREPAHGHCFPALASLSSLPARASSGHESTSTATTPAPASRRPLPAAVVGHQTLQEPAAESRAPGGCLARAHWHSARDTTGHCGQQAHAAPW